MSSIPLLRISSRPALLPGPWRPPGLAATASAAGRSWFRSATSRDTTTHWPNPNTYSYTADNPVNNTAPTPTTSSLPTPSMNSISNDSQREVVISKSL